MRLRLLLVLSILLTSTAVAQTTRKSTTKSANVRSGTLAAIDPAGATVTLKSAAGTETIYRLTEKTQILKGKRPVEIGAFKTGDSVTVRFRKSSVGPASLYDLCDKTSWEWLSRIRKETTKVKIKAIDEGELQAEEGPDAAPITYRITEKTTWSKGGKPASEGDFKAGDVVYVVPRMLPGGNIMATAVADTTQNAAQLKERAKYTVAGVLTKVDLPSHKIGLKSVSNDLRELTLANDCEVRAGGKDVPLTHLKVGQTITAHLHKTEDDEQEVTRITILSKRTIKKPTGKTPVKKIPSPKPDN